MSTEPLKKELIPQPGVWRLELMLADDAAHAVFFSPLEDHALIHRRLPLPGGAGVAALEEMVYDNPLLLSPFERVDILLDTPRFMLLPAEIADAGLSDAAVGALWPGRDAETLVSPVPGTPWRMAVQVPARTLAFLRRTFPDAAITHRLAPLTAWLGSRSAAGSGAKACVHLRHGAIDVLCFIQGRPALVNTFSTPSIPDIVYFTLAAMQVCGMDPASDEIHLCGNPALRDQVRAALRVRATYVMPVIFPSAMFKAGREAMEAPFELIVLPLCV